MKKIISFLLASIITLSCALSVGAVTEDELQTVWDTISSNDFEISVSPGADSTQMRFCFMADFFTENEFYYGLSKDLSDAKEAEIKSSLTAFAKKECNINLSGLSPDTTYYYRYSIDGKMSDIYSFTTDEKDKDFTALFISDVQIGRSGDWQEYPVQLHDTAGWHTTLEEAVETNSDISVCLSTGDQVQNATSSLLYNLFLSPSTLRSLPIAVTPGNHEIGSPYLSYHFNNANEFSETVVPATIMKPYYFCKGNALFIVLDSNNAFALDQEALIERAVKDYPDTKWRVVMMHHGVYSCEDAGDENPNNRNSLVPLFQKYDIDLVLQGHSHMYSRTAPMVDSKPDEKGIVYIEGGCASGSNCKLTPEELPEYAVFGNSEIKNPIYTVLSFSDDEIDVKAYAVVDGDSVQIDETTVINNGRNDSNAQISTANKILHFVLSIPNRIFSLFY